MSYILDALRRAESERKQGRLPTPLDPPIAGLPPHSPEPARARWLWMAGGACVVLLAGVLGALLMRSATPPQRPTPPAVAAVPPAAPVLQSVPLAPEPRLAPSLAIAPPPHASTQPAPIREVAAQPAPLREAPPARPAPVAVPAPTPAPASPLAAMPEEGAAPALAELPEEVRRALPPMRFEGTVYSDTASSRMLMINGQLLHEGESLNADIRVERIKPRSAVLSYRGQRFEFSRQ